MKEKDFLNTTETTILSLLMSHANSIVTYAQLQKVVKLNNTELENALEKLDSKIDMSIEPMPFMGFMLKTIS